MSFLLQGAKNGKMLFYIFSAVLLGICIFYAFFVNQIVLNIVERKNIEKKIAEINTEIGDLEHSYVQKQSSITMEYAQSVGFHEVKEPHYVSRNSANVLTLHEEL